MWQKRVIIRAQSLMLAVTQLKLLSRQTSAMSVASPQTQLMVQKELPLKLTIADSWRHNFKFWPYFSSGPFLLVSGSSVPAQSSDVFQKQGLLHCVLFTDVCQSLPVSEIEIQLIHWGAYLLLHAFSSKWCNDNL